MSSAFYLYLFFFLEKCHCLLYLIVLFWHLFLVSLGVIYQLSWPHFSSCLLMSQIIWLILISFFVPPKPSGSIFQYHRQLLSVLLLRGCYDPTGLFSLLIFFLWFSRQHIKLLFQWMQQREKTAGKTPHKSCTEHLRLTYDYPDQWSILPSAACSA